MTTQGIYNYIANLNQRIIKQDIKIKKMQYQNASLDQETKESDITIPNRVINRFYNLVDDSTSSALLGTKADFNVNQISDTYNKVAKVDKKSSVVEGLVFKNNQEFDFKV